MFPLGPNAVSGVVHWMIVKLGLTLHNVLVQPKQTINKEEMFKGLYQVPEIVKKKENLFIRQKILQVKLQKPSQWF